MRITRLDKKENETEILKMFSLCGSGKYRHMFVGKIYRSRERQLAVMQLEAQAAQANESTSGIWLHTPLIINSSFDTPKTPNSLA